MKRREREGERECVCVCVGVCLIDRKQRRRKYENKFDQSTHENHNSNIQEDERSDEEKRLWPSLHRRRSRRTYCHQIARSAVHHRPLLTNKKKTRWREKPEIF